ncbi:MAG: histidine kinase dimerization/phospho-acceptor domain-containing protein [Pyrinomonadaceae bacterium]
MGIVASLSDVSKQRELHQTKNDVMTLVTHELRTPLTAIQGMSEVLSQYDVDESGGARCTWQSMMKRSGWRE